MSGKKLGKNLVRKWVKIGYERWGIDWVRIE